MAEEDKKSFSIKIIIIGVLLFLLGGALVFGFAVFFMQPSGETEVAAEEKTEIPGILVRAGEFTVNIAEPGAKRYLKTEIYIEVKDEKQQKELEGKIPVVQDRILAVLSSKSLNDLEVYNRDNLRQELLNQINKGLGKADYIKNVYFTVFVMQ